jgi:RND family efflux transporter MFP subunit
MMNEEKAGSTRIIWLMPEGTEVHKGEVICELDSSAFKDELQAQRIRWAAAKALVEQADAIYQVNEITLREYRDGAYPLDVEVVRDYILQCEVQVERARKAEKWSREVFEKKYRAAAQYQADKLSLEQAELALREARGMEERLVKFTMPRLVKSLEANLKAIETDKLAQRKSFEVEDDRLRRLERVVANCTIRAPGDGILVYNNQSNGWSGQVEVAIQEGVTVREGQTLFDLPDPKHMRVKVKINESKMASVHPGQKARVRVEAFPGRELTGTVTEITPIPAVQNRFSDIKIYFAFVEIDSGEFEGLRPGMTSEVSFLIDADPNATRVPIQAVRWAGGRSFVAVAARVGREIKWDWRPVTLGLLSPSYAEVVKGLTPGEKVVAAPETLPAPDPGKIPPEVRTASTKDPEDHGG